MANYGNVRLTVDGRPDLKKKTVTLEVGGKPLDDVLDGFRKSVKKIENKQDKIKVVDIADAIDVRLGIETDTIYNCGVIGNSLRLGLPLREGTYTSFIAQVNFSTTDFHVEMIYPDSIKWTGDSVEDGEFVPEENKRYVIIIMHDGVYWRANVQGVSIDNKGEVKPPFNLEGGE